MSTFNSEIYILEDGTEVEIEISHSPEGQQPIGIGQKAKKSFKSAIAKVKPLANEIFQTLEGIERPDEVEVKLGAKLGGKTDLIISSADAEATFQIRLLWKKTSTS